MHTNADKVVSTQNPLRLSLPKTDVKGENYIETAMEINEYVASSKEDRKQ
jgi:hypothetical protein